jgi:hypothetical protein
VTERLATLPERREIRELLRARMSDRLVKALFAGGWKAVVGEAQAETDEIREELQAMTRGSGA